MSEESEFELVRGSGNVFRDFEDPDADLKQAKAVLAANIIAALDERQLTVREANRLTGFAAADFSRIRNANLGRFTLDRLMRIFFALGTAATVSIQVSPHPSRKLSPAAPAAPLTRVVARPSTV
ncbi:MAG: XRE family transcriptional regulator [Gammaproteobacteria bacterium]|nr:XRE family transcriptional regulator [Gammaproteobacteria bacterium]